MHLFCYSDPAVAQTPDEDWHVSSDKWKLPGRPHHISSPSPWAAREILKLGDQTQVPALPGVPHAQSSHRLSSRSPHLARSSGGPKAHQELSLSQEATEEVFALRTSPAQAGMLVGLGKTTAFWLVPLCLSSAAPAPGLACSRPSVNIGRGRVCGPAAQRQGVPCRIQMSLPFVLSSSSSHGFPHTRAGDPLPALPKARAGGMGRWGLVESSPFTDFACVPFLRVEQSSRLYNFSDCSDILPDKESKARGHPANKRIPGLVFHPLPPSILAGLSRKPMLAHGGSLRYTVP